MKLFAALVLIAVPAALVYLQFFGLDARLRERVAAALSGPAARVEIGRLRFSVFDGLLAEGVKVFRPGPGDELIAKVDEVALALNLASLVGRRVEVDAVRVENGEAAIPFAEDGREPDVVRVAGIAADVKLLPGQVFITSLEARLGDVRIALRGRLLNPEKLELPEPEGDHDPEAVARSVRRALAIFEEIRFEGSPQIEAEVSGNLADLATLRAEQVKVRLGAVKFRDFEFDDVSADGEYAEGGVRISNVDVSGPSANLKGSGTWLAEAESGSMTVSGSVAPEPILALVDASGATTGLVFGGEPKLGARVELKRRDGRLAWKAVGRAESGALEFKEIEVSNVTGSFSADGVRFFVQDLVVGVGSGTIAADVMGGPGGFQVRGDLDVDPLELMPVLGPKEREILGRMEFAENAVVEITLSGPELKFKSMTGDGTLRLGKTAMRGVWIDSAEARLVLADRAVRYDDFVVRKDGGVGTGTFTYDFGKQEVRLDGIESKGLDAPAVLMWVNPKISETVATYRFNRPPDVRLDGVIKMGDPGGNDLRIEVDAPGGMSYTLLKRDLEFGPTQGRVRVAGRQLTANVEKTTLYGGAAKIDASVSIDREDPSFSVAIALDDVDFAKLTDLYFGYDRSKGKLSGDYRFDASLRNPSMMVGRGRIRVDNGHVLEIPLFGPLSKVLDSIIPGAGHENARLATADFTVGRERLRTENLEIKGEGFEMAGEGSVGFPSGQLDLSMRINARGIPGIVLLPVSKLFEYQSNGTVSDPRWKPKLVPKEFWQVLGMEGEAEQRTDSEGVGEEPAKAAGTNFVPGRARGGGRKR